VEAVSFYRKTPRRVDLAATSEEAATSLFADGRDQEALELLDEVAKFYVEVGADAYLARVESLLRAHGVRHRRRGPARATHGWESLSPNERKIVDLVVQGLSNPQIGGLLYISRRTVETHLSHVFGKLNVSSRAQVAAVAATAQALRADDRGADPSSAGPHRASDPQPSPITS
jgi:DNA-binding CsgD family transcriptional regulator